MISSLSAAPPKVLVPCPSGPPLLCNAERPFRDEVNGNNMRTSDHLGLGDRLFRFFDFLSGLSFSSCLHFECNNLYINNLQIKSANAPIVQIIITR